MKSRSTIRFPLLLVTACAVLLAGCAAVKAPVPAKPVLLVPSAAPLAAQMAMEEMAASFPGVELRLEDRSVDRATRLAEALCEQGEGLGRSAAGFARDKLVKETLYVLAATDANAQRAGQEFSMTLKAAGRRVALSTVVQDGESDFSPILNRAAVDKPELMVFAGRAEAARSLRQHFQERRLETPMLFIDVSGEGEAIAGALTVSAAPPLASLPEAAGFAAKFLARSQRPADRAAMCAYDATRLWLSAAASAGVARAGSPASADEVWHRLPVVRLEGLSGKISFEPDGRPRLSAHFLLRPGLARAEPLDRNAPAESSSKPTLPK